MSSVWLDKSRSQGEALQQTTIDVNNVCAHVSGTHVVHVAAAMSNAAISSVHQFPVVNFMSFFAGLVSNLYCTQRPF